MTDSDLDYNVKHAAIIDTMRILGLTQENRTKHLERINRDRDLKKLHKQSTIYWNQMRSEEFALENENLRQHQVNNLGGFYKIFPIEDANDWKKIFFKDFSSLKNGVVQGKPNPPLEEG